MPQIALSTRWSIKPPPSTPVQFGHPHAQGLMFAAMLQEGGGRSHCVPLPGYAPVQTGLAWKTGRDGAAVDCSGSGLWNYGTVPALNALTSTFTVEVLVKRTGSTGAYQMLFLVGADGTNGWGLYTSATNTHSFLKSSVVALDSGVASTLNAWEHVVWVVQSDTQVLLYINGSLQYGPTNNQAIVASTGSARLGGDFVASESNWWQGLIGHCRVWRRAFTGGEVRDLYVNPYAMFAHPRCLRA